MKKILLVIVVLFFGMHLVKAQIENIRVDSVLTLNSVYAGLLSGADFSKDSLSFSKSSTIRIGAKITYSPMKWISLIGVSMYEIDGEAKAKTGNQFWTKVDFGKICFETGFVPTLVSETKPMPVTADAQFESWTEAGLPGAALGAKLKYNLGKKSYLGIGVAKRNREPEYHLKYSSDSLKAAIYYSKFNKKLGLSLAVKSKRIYNSTVFNATQNLSNLISYKLNTKNDIDFYFDIKYDLKVKDIGNLETGFLKNFSGKYLKGFIGLSYCYEIRVVRGYFFIHI